VQRHEQPTGKSWQLSCHIGVPPRAINLRTLCELKDFTNRSKLDRVSANGSSRAKNHGRGMKKEEVYLNSACGRELASAKRTIYLSLLIIPFGQGHPSWRYKEVAFYEFLFTKVSVNKNYIKRFY